MNDLSVRILADVSSAVNGLQQFSDKMKSTVTTVSQLGSNTQVAASQVTGAISEIRPTSNIASESIDKLAAVINNASEQFSSATGNLSDLNKKLGESNASSDRARTGFDGIKNSLIGRIGFGFALGVVTDAITDFIGGLLGSSDKVNVFSESIKGAKGEFTKMFSEIEKTKVNIELVKEGIITSDAALTQYNSTIGQLTGTMTNWSDAEQMIINNSDKIIEVTIKRAAATMAFNKSAEQAFNAFSLTDLKKEAMWQLPDFLQKSYSAKVDKEISRANKLQKDFEAIGKSFTKSAEEIAKALNFGKSGAISKAGSGLKIENLKVPEVKVKPEKITIRPPLGSVELEKGTVLKPPEIKLSELQKAISKIHSELAKDLPDIKIPAPKFNFADNLKEDREALQRLLDIATKVGDAISDVFGNVFEALMNGKNVIKSVGESLKELVIDIGRAIIKMVVMKAISMAVPGLGSLMPFRASGGAVTGGSPYIVGERGPELFIPSTTGRIEPNGRGLFNQGAIMVNLNGQFIQRGSDMVAVISQVSASQRRLS